VLVDLDVPLMPGDGVVFDGDRIAGEEIGGRIFQVFLHGKRIDQPTAGRVELAFQHGLINEDNVRSGIPLWQTDSPQLTKRLRSTFESKQPRFKREVEMSIVVRAGEPVQCSVWVKKHPDVRRDWTQDYLPEVARKHPLSEGPLLEQLNRLGNTPYVLSKIHATIDGNPMLPLSVMGDIRKSLVEYLDRLLLDRPQRTVATGRSASMLREVETKADSTNATPQLVVLVRSLGQLEAVLREGQKFVYADFHDIREYEKAVAIAHEAGAQIYLATLRIQKPGESGLFRAMEKRPADGWLVRNLAALDYARRAGIPAIADFSLNATNPLTADWLIERGAHRFTASYDLNRDQLTELVVAVPRPWIEVVIHQHMPMFHMEHCVFCTVLSPGTNKTNCGRPCDRHDVKLRDRLGVEHVLHADIGCRNTLYNGHAQSGAEATPTLIRLGVRYFRVELLRDASHPEIAEVLSLYRELLAGSLEGTEVWKRLKATNRLGVTRGTLEHPRNPLAIL
jgi:putative protease